MSRLLRAVALALLPEKLTGRWIYRIARSRIGWLKHLLITGFCRIYKVDLTEAATPDPKAYASFNDFFTRALRQDARPLAPGDDVIACPADGTLAEFGTIEAQSLLQAKGKSYTIAALLDESPSLLEAFNGGSYLTVYLAPYNYHRVHTPVAGSPDRIRYVPGRRYSVNAETTASIDEVYCRNERVAVWLASDFGYVVVVLVGAFNVASLTTVVTGEIASGAPQLISAEAQGRLARGAEVGRFNLGSTVVLVFPRGTVEWDASLVSGQAVQMGQALGRLTAPGVD